jgi:hypothetical protein
MRELRVIGYPPAARFRSVLDRALTRYAASGDGR